MNNRTLGAPRWGQESGHWIFLSLYFAVLLGILIYEQFRRRRRATSGRNAAKEPFPALPGEVGEDELTSLGTGCRLDAIRLLSGSTRSAVQFLDGRVITRVRFVWS